MRASARTPLFPHPAAKPWRPFPPARTGEMDGRGRRPAASTVQDQAYFSSQQFRTFTIADMMRLQGVDENMFAGWDEILSPRQMGSLIGNAMCQSIVERVLRGIYLSLGVPCK
ncbi:unnamed protein product [Prorocentrum cordatum]|uniref:DNA (cytosine-5-)-methyltransferase n=1 Tax=Prorocentrum cordatum TaxID=2364126 RepID=A0ABN9TV74_9DINO|nr:unnamed protein product [Polarella glacialis]